MFAPPFFQSAGRGDLLSWGEKEGLTVVIWESLSGQEKESWLEESSTMHIWVVWYKSKKGAEEIRSFELSVKEIFSNYDETKSKEEKNKKNGSNKKAHRGQSVRYRSWWKQGNFKMAVSEDHDSCWVHNDLIVTTKQYLCNNQALLKAVKRWVGEGGKATSTGAPDADILLEAIEELRKRTVGSATFLVKVKAHRGESANEEADIQADKAISGKDFPTK